MKKLQPFSKSPYYRGIRTEPPEAEVQDLIKVSRILDRALNLGEVPKDLCPWVRRATDYLTDLSIRKKEAL